jgi:hypothetical protein
MEQARNAAMQAIGGRQNRSMARFLHSDIMKINLLKAMRNSK